MSGSGGDSVRLVRCDDLSLSLANAFERLQLTPEDAEGLAGLLLDSELRGHPDHGAAVLATLAVLYRDGTLNPRPHVRVLDETEGAILLEGDRGCGPSAPTRAMEWCVERARERKGMAVAAVRDWQFLVGGPYVRLGAEAGLIGFTCTNFVRVAPPGGRTPVFGTNPFAYAIPAARHPPVVLDVATTVTAMQKVRLAAEQGEPMPEGLIFDREGRPTTDPRKLLEGGLMAPLGNPHAPHKGFGLALFVDALAGVLSGVLAARRAPSYGRSTWRRFCLGTSSWREWTSRSTRSSKASGCRASRSCSYPASAASDATRSSPLAAWFRWRRQAGRCWPRAASRSMSLCPRSR
jgi:LDH2 family malate/lactate/ureidoglycolate dehydrogenase